jgi:mono/diheme cytochrome c family protein
MIMNDEIKREAPIPSEKNEISALDLHAQAMRETDEPIENMFIGPKWFYLLLVLALVIGAFYLGRHMGRLDTASHIGFLQSQAAQGQANSGGGDQGGAGEGNAAQGATKQANAPSGASIFSSRCSSCHQANGQGVPGAFPPLVGASYVLGDPEVVVRILLQGLQGEIEVSGQKYNGIMPPWGPQLNDAEIAAVINHIRNGLGTNKAPTIEEDLVKKIRDETKDRQTPWTAEELKAVAKS